MRWGMQTRRQQAASLGSQHLLLCVLAAGLYAWEEEEGSCWCLEGVMRRKNTCQQRGAAGVFRCN